MRILAIETSCDETAIAVVDFAGPKTRPAIKIFSNIVSSQVKLHAKFGGVVPNLAKREHQRNLPFILKRALKESKLLKISNFQFPISKQILKIQTLEKIFEREPELLKRFKKYILLIQSPKIDAIAITIGPGLAPALWVGVNFAKALAYLWKKPLIPVNHMEGHLYSAFLQKSGENSNFQILNPKFPILALLVSGGHTELVLARGYGKYKIVGETLDDAAGEAFDKVARILGLGYPGGPVISAEAKKILNSKPAPYRSEASGTGSEILNKFQIKLPRPMLNSKDYNFSFSGLKTAVLYLVRDLSKKYSIKVLRPTIAREFQDAAVEVLVKKTIKAAKDYKAKTVLLGGGVAANSLLRHRLFSAVAREILNSKFLIPDSSLCGDNALMIALAAYFSGKKKAPMSIGAEANLRF